MTVSKHHVTSKSKGILKADYRTFEVAPGIHVPYVLMSDAEGNPIAVQTPLPVDGDSVYCKDINQELSDVGSFSSPSDASVCDLFNDYQSTITAEEASGSSPKTLTITLQRPLRTSIIGFGSPDTNLSNGKLYLKGVDGEDVRTPVDMSADDTKRGVMFFAFEETAFIEIVVEFHTDDEVSINGCFIPKTTSVTIDAINGLIPVGAQTRALQGPDEEWTSEIIDTKNYVWIIASATSDVASAIDGYVIEFSTDKINWYWQSIYTVGAGKAKTFSDQPVARYMQVRYKNGADQQGVFDLTTQLKPTASKASSHRINDPIDGEDDATLQKSILTAFSELTSVSENITSFRGALSVNQALVHKVGINARFHRLDGVSTVTTAPIAVDDISFPVASVAGLTIGDLIQVVTGAVTGETFITITNIVALVITGDQPFATAVASGVAVDKIETNMASTAGSLVSPVIYSIHPPAGAIWQMTRMMISLTASTAMDDGKFGGITALTNGMLIRGQATIIRNASIWKDNGDLALDMFDVAYTDKAPAGENGLRGRWTFTKGEFIVELNGDEGDSLDVYTQDDITANTRMVINCQGRLFGG